jgi:hypothetical protein
MSFQQYLGLLMQFIPVIWNKWMFCLLFLENINSQQLKIDIFLRVKRIPKVNVYSFVSVSWAPEINWMYPHIATVTVLSAFLETPDLAN